MPPGDDQVPTLAGAAWQRVSPSLCNGDVVAAQKLSAQLAEVTVYLLVWGEAGNLRFMPELLYFITEVILAAEPSGCAPYGDVACSDTLQPTEMEVGSRGGHRSSLFLAHVVRPIYNVVFDEYWEHVSVNAQGREARKMHEGFDAFLPRDVANYDDWNELFCDPERLVDCLVLRTTCEQLFARRHGVRFEALVDVDWRTALDGTKTKTHREIHSLWGVFAAVHRVVFLHAILFFLTLFVAAEERLESTGLPVMRLSGSTMWIRLGALGLVLPFHGLLVTFAHWHVTGKPVRTKNRCRIIVSLLFWLVPVGTYVALRLAEARPVEQRRIYLFAHCGVCALGTFFLLFLPDTLSSLKLWELTRVTWYTKCLRYLFWALVFGVKFFFGLSVSREVLSASQDLLLVLPGHETLEELHQVVLSTVWTSNVLEWLLLWITTFLLFVADTQLWFLVGCTVLGTIITLVQRRCNALQCTFEDAVSMIPKRFSEKLLPYAALQELCGHDDANDVELSSKFPPLWDRIVEYMRYEDKCDSSSKANLCFQGIIGHSVKYSELSMPIALRGEPAASASKRDGPGWSVNVPDLFRYEPVCERVAKHYCFVPDDDWPVNEDMQWRLLALSRGLALPMPRPYRAPYIPGITILIPHYAESILLQTKELYDSDFDGADVPLIDWLATRYQDEFNHFTNRQQEFSQGAAWPHSGTQWFDYSDAQWAKICGWSSMRMQTLWRTVAGMCLYHPALQALYEAQGDMSSSMARAGAWDPAECFTCLVSMQMYKYFNAVQLQHTNKMLSKFPKCLHVAYIDHEPKEPNHHMDRVHVNQERRYFSCLIDSGCPERPDGSRVPRLRVELPGYPILGDGKGDNQNHALPFMRGSFAQCVDANQGAYFEQMLMMPCVLGEFRTEHSGDGRAKRIVGLPEHITSDIGSIGDFAASAELAFGTLLQRSYSVLGARMHYGHPDVMNKEYMMQQGGVSKATKTLHLSEDIFAGMDFTLRGQGRTIHHCEYLHLAKGRDLGFNTVLAFFSKLSSGAGEQIISRQMFRLGNSLDLPEALTFWYAHVGYYMTQFLISLGMPMLVFVWLLVLLSDCEKSLPSFSTCSMAEENVGGSAVMTRALSTWFSTIMLFFWFATNLPLFCQIWYERSLKLAFLRFVKQMATLSPILFIFQSKIIGFYVMNELRFGGATYVSTGRGLPTERRPFIGKCLDGRFKLDKAKVGGLYLDYARITMYHGVKLLIGAVLVLVVSHIQQVGSSEGTNRAASSQLWSMWVSVWITVISWLFAPFIFNPYQFELRRFCADVRAWFAFFWDDMGMHWVLWWEKTQLRAGQTNRRFQYYLLDISLFVGFFFFAAWYAALNLKLHVISNVFSKSLLITGLHVGCLMPPVFSSIAFSSIVTLIEGLLETRNSTRGQVASEETDSDTDQQLPSRCPTRLPLLLSAFWVTFLALLESVTTLVPLLHLQWYNTFIAGIILKWGLRGVLITLGENLMRSRCFHKGSCIARTIAHWVRASRMFREAPGGCRVSRRQRDRHLHGDCRSGVTSCHAAHAGHAATRWGRCQAGPFLSCGHRSDAACPVTRDAPVPLQHARF
eukprot:TRINITY_DN29045_c0_g2_i2.p1 TRINITY_DN29045_c0_g2~~TRINITY_DN29045_c0_g2_i2.p1  ORF type:complete len:1616 (-),score=185.82 TRINITY_DN29045_c0_g2_i2:54-4793(-)